MTIVVHHNPKCSTSRKVLAAAEASGQPVHVVEYLKTGWTEPQLRGLFAAAGMTARDALRRKGALVEELGLLDEAVPEEALLEAMVAHPVLVERPIVCSPRGVRLCRPVERLDELL